VALHRYPMHGATVGAVSPGQGIYVVV